MTDKNVLLAIFERNDFYRRQYFRALAAFGLSLIVLAMLGCVLVYVARNPAPPLYFATDSVGRLIKVKPISTPNMSNADVAAWTVNAVEKANSFDYVNYRSQLQSAQQYFTQYGWKQYMIALKKSKNLDAVTMSNNIFEARVIGSPKLVAEGLLGKAYAWKYEVQMLLTVLRPPYDEKNKLIMALNTQVVVQRQSILQSNDGLGIVQMIGEVLSGTQNDAPAMSNRPSR